MLIIVHHPNPVETVNSSKPDQATIDAYETIAGLPDDEIQLGILESFHERCTTLAIGRVVVPF